MRSEISLDTRVDCVCEKETLCCQKCLYCRQGYHRFRTKNKEAGEILILLPEKKKIVSVCTTNVRSYVSLFISRNHLLQHVLFSTSFLESSRKTIFSLCYFLNQNLRSKTSFHKNPNQSTQFTVLAMPDSALRLCAARLYYFYDIKKL